MVGSRVGQTHARMQPMSSLLRRAFSRLLDSTPNYVEVTAVLAVALIARLLYLPDIRKASPQPCVAVALFVSVFLYACVDRGRLFTYFGWARPPRLVSWLYALLGGVSAAVGVLSVLRVAHMSLGAARFSGEVALRCHPGPDSRRGFLPRSRVLRDLCNSVFGEEPGTASNYASNHRLFPALRACAHENCWNPVVFVLWDGNSLRDDALAIKLNRNRSSHARHIQRNDCVGDASWLIDHKWEAEQVWSIAVCTNGCRI
jgi:hypothetical protein